MTQLLKTALQKLNELSDSEQDAFALRILEEIAADKKWEKRFSDTTEEQWKRMLEEVDKEIKDGNHESIEDIFSE